MGSFQSTLPNYGKNCTLPLQTGSSNLWYFPEAFWLLLPLGICWTSFLYLFVEHSIHLEHEKSWQIRYQALYARIVGFFPIIATMGLFAAFYPWTYTWFNVIFGIIEGYLITCFYALVVGLGWLKSHGNYPESIIEIQNRPNQPWYTIIRRWPKYKTGEQALYAWKWGVLQLMIVKPATLIVIASVSTASTGKAVTPVLNALMRLFSTISVLIAIQTSVRAYVTTRDIKGRPLHGHDGVYKLLTIKLLFTFILFDQVLISPLIQNGNIPIDSWICPAAVVNCTEMYSELCILRLEAVVFISQVTILSLPAFLFFRHGELSDTPHCNNSLALYFFKCVLSYGDLEMFWSGDLPENKVFLNTDEEQQSQEKMKLLQQQPQQQQREEESENSNNQQVGGGTLNVVIS
jgi:hypothetical protein